MSRTVVVSVPHKLSRTEARHRLEQGFSRLTQQLGGRMMAMEESWDGDRLDFRAAALGQTITGHLDVLDDVVRIELELPAFLASLADSVSGRLKSEATLLLEKK
jgi:putative polyhydroxyalkanoate system protein